MAREIIDNPSGWSKTLPGHTVEYDSNYALPWSETLTLETLAGRWSHVSLTIADDDYIYIVNMVSVTPQANVVFGASVVFNDITYMFGVATGWINFPVSQNPSLQFITGDVIAVWLNNLDASNRTYYVVLNGTKIPKPAGWTHGPF